MLCWLFWSEITTLFAPSIFLYLVAKESLGSALGRFHLLSSNTSKTSSNNNNNSDKTKLIWIHGASIGESQCSLILSKLIASDHHRFLFTCSNWESVKFLKSKIASSDIYKYVDIFPVDVSWSVEIFLRKWKPDVAIFIQSELWPVTMQCCHEKKIPLVLLNARISDRSFCRWSKVGLNCIFRRMISQFENIVAQCPEAADRIHALTGRTVSLQANIKFLAPSNNIISFDKNDAIARFIGRRKVWIAASTHNPEEQFVIEAHNKIKQQWPKNQRLPLLIIAPRHIHRVSELVQKFGGIVPSQLHSSNNDAYDDNEILYVDTIGQLMSYYSLADVAVVGGSLTFPSVGGHNILEPAAIGKAVVTGQYTYNNVDLVEELNKIEGNCIQLVSTAEELSDCVAKLLLDDEYRALRGHKIQQAAAVLRTKATQTLMHSVIPIIERLKS